VCTRGFRATEWTETKLIASRSMALRLLTAALLATVVASHTITASSSALSPLLSAPYAAPPSRAAAAAAAASGGAAASSVYVDCASGSDANSGATPAAALRTVAAALAKADAAAAVHVAGGVCPLTAPLKIGPQHAGLRLVGEGKTALSGGAAITGWKPSAAHTGPGLAGKVFEADVSGFPLEEIKLLRLGGARMNRTRWPKLSGTGATRGLTTPNWMFVMPWSNTSGVNKDRQRAPMQVRVRCRLTLSPPPPRSPSPSPAAR